MLKRLSRIALTLVVSVSLLFVSDRIFAPVPIPAGTAVIGGLLVLWSRDDLRAVWVGSGFAIGGAIGAAMHLYVHLTGRSTLPEEGVPAHVATDGIHGLAVGAVILLIALGAWVLPSTAWEDRQHREGKR